jgi:hypothetical protein
MQLGLLLETFAFVGAQGKLALAHNCILQID